jgi:hypothetical protein
MRTVNTSRSHKASSLRVNHFGGSRSELGNTPAMVLKKMQVPGISRDSSCGCTRCKEALASGRQLHRRIQPDVSQLLQFDSQLLIGVRFTSKLGGQMLRVVHWLR